MHEWTHNYLTISLKFLQLSYKRNIVYTAPIFYMNSKKL